MSKWLLQGRVEERRRTGGWIKLYFGGRITMSTQGFYPSKNAADGYFFVLPAKILCHF